MREPQPKLSRTQRRVLDRLAIGGSPREAAKRAKISVRTIHKWRQRYSWWPALEKEARTGTRVHAGTDVTPVSVHEFITSPDYLNAAGAVYPVVLDECERIADGEFTEVLCTGGIGSGKTYTAVMSLLYLIYRLSCMEAPQAEYGLDPSSELVIALQNRTERSAKTTAFALMRSMIGRSPYFQRAFPPDRRLKSRLAFPKNVAVEPFAGNPEAVLGRNVIGALLDEANFFQAVEKSLRSIDGERFDPAMENYDNMIQRLKSRFPGGGWLYFISSSRRYQGQFSDSIERRARYDDSIFIYDHVVWDIRPDEFEGERFQVFMGGRGKISRILREDERVSSADRDRVVSVPAVFRPQFESNLTKALQNIAGRAVEPQGAYFQDQSIIRRAMALPNLRMIRTADAEGAAALLYPVGLDAPDPEHWRVLSFDVSTSRDLTGIACAYCAGYRGAKPLIFYDFVARLHPPKGRELNIGDLEMFAVRLRERGLPIGWISTDQFQSKMLRQNLAARGFQTMHVSVDRTRPDAPLLAAERFKEGLAEGRIALTDDEGLFDELAHLMVDWEKQRITPLPRKRNDSADAVMAASFVLHELPPNLMGFPAQHRQAPSIGGRVTTVMGHDPLEGWSVDTARFSGSLDQWMAEPWR